MSKPIDWETEIMYRGRPLSDYRKAIVEECARNVRRETLEEAAWMAESFHAYDHSAHEIAAAIRALKDKP